MDRAALRQRVKDRGYGTDNDSVINEAIRSTYRRVLGAQRWPFLRDSADINVAIGAVAVSLSTITDLGHLHSLYWSQTGSIYPLVWKTDEEFLELAEQYYSNSVYTRGIPAIWTRTSDQVVSFFPAAEIAGVLSVQFSKIHDLDDDADDPLFNSIYDDILVWGALSDIAYRERDWAAQDRAEVKFNTVLQQMIGEYGVEQQQSPREVVSSGFFDEVNRSV